MVNLIELKNALLADGIIDAEEVKIIKDVIYEDGKIDKEEVDFLFELNDAVSGHNNSPEWDKLFVKAITSFMLEDEVSPNEIDDEETEYLYNKINGDGHVDGVEKALLLNLKAKSKNFPTLLASLL